MGSKDTMFDELIANIRQLIEGSVANTEQEWDYSIRIRYRISDKNTFIIYEKDKNQKRIEIEEDEDE